MTVNAPQGQATEEPPAPVEESGTGEVSDIDGTQGTGQVADSPLQDFVDGLLAEVPEELRPQFEPYVKKWDAGVTRRFQDIHNQYKPYKELGEVDELQQAKEIYEMLRDDPQRVYGLLAEHLGVSTGQGTLPGVESPSSSETAGLPPEYLQKLNQLEQIVNPLAEYILEQQRQSRQAEEDRQLDEYLGLLRQEYGDFDEDWVLTKVSQGMEIDAAVKAWHSKVEEIRRAGQPEQQQIPFPVLGGEGSAPVGGPNVTQLGTKDVKDLVAGLVQQAQAQSS